MGWAGRLMQDRKNKAKEGEHYMKLYTMFPKSCIGCPHETPTGMCGKLFNLDKFLKNRCTTGFDVRHTKRRKDCPLTEHELIKNNVKEGK